MGTLLSELLQLSIRIDHLLLVGRDALCIETPQEYVPHAIYYWGY